VGFIKDAWDDFTGKTAGKAALQSAEIQGQAVTEGIATTEAAREQGLGFLQPFQQVGQQGIDQAGFLTDPNAQFDFLQSNPLFQMALDNANAGTSKMAAARGRLSAGDTLEQLSKNVLLSASPLIQSQKQSISDLLNVGTDIAGSQANIAIGAGTNITDLITSGGAVKAAGMIGASDARSAGTRNILSLAGLA